MALSGSRTVGFCSRGGSNRYYLKWTWSATQSITNNTSTVTVKLFIGSYGNGYGMNASSTKSGWITINGNSKQFTTAGISLASGGSKHLATHTVTIPHNSDGTKSFGINAGYNPAVTISGTYQGNFGMGAVNYTLNQIARASSLSSGAGWKFPNNQTISISRKSSSFTHTVRVYVGGTLIKTWTKTSSTSFSTSFSVDENKTILGKLGSGLSASCEIQLDTYSGSTKIGSTVSKTGTVTAYGRSSTTFPSSFNIGSSISGKITENHSSYTHTLELQDANGTTMFTILNQSGNLDWSYTPTASTLYQKTPNSNSYTGKIRLSTYYSGVVVGRNVTNITWKVTNSNPTFNPTKSYHDGNPTTVNVTGNNQYIVQNKSHFVGYCKWDSSTLAAKNYATISTISCTVAGRTIEVGAAGKTEQYFPFYEVNASSNQSVVFTAKDSRGNKTSVSLTAKFIPYTPPKIVAKVERANKFSKTVNVDSSGSYSALWVDGTAKNYIDGAVFKYGIDGAGYGSDIGFTSNAANGSFVATRKTFELSETSIAKVLVYIRDKLNGEAWQEIEVPTGLPIMYLDADNGSISFNCLPKYDSTMHLGVKLDLAANQYWGNGYNTYGLHANNSDIIGLNSLIFHDACNNLGEGLRYPNSNSGYGTSTNHTAPSDYGAYTNIYWKDNWCYINNVKSFGLTSGSGQSAKYQVDCDCFTLNHVADANGSPSNKTGFRIVEGTTIELAIDANEAFCFKDSGASYGSFGWNVQSMNFYVWDSTNSAATNTRLSSDSTSMFFQSPPVYQRAGTGGSAVVVSSAGTLYRSTSTAKAKLDIVPAYDSLEDYKKVLDIEPVKWFDKYACEANAAFMTAEVDGTECDLADRPNLNRVYGCVAEQLEEIGLDGLIYYDDENKEIASVAYDRIPIMYIPLFKDLYNQVEELKAEIQTLKGETGK